MKNFSQKISFVFLILLTIGIGNVAFAQTADEVFHKFQYANPTNQQNQGNNASAEQNNSVSKIGLISALPDKSWQDTLGSIVKIILNITGAIALISFTAGGIFMIAAHGNPDLTEKGKKIVIYSIIGLIIIAASYALVLGVSQLQFFTPGTATNSQTPATNEKGTQSLSTPQPTGIDANGAI